MIERQIADVVVEHFYPIGITEWYHEVPHPDRGSTGKRADLVARMDGKLVAVECKARLSLDLMIQAVRWYGWAEHINVCFADAQKGWQEAVGPWFEGWGIGAMVVDLRTGKLRRYYTDTEIPAPHRPALEAMLTPERDGRDARAGSAGGHYVTEWRQAYLRVSEWVAGNPGNTLEDAMKVAGIHPCRTSRDRVVDALRRLEIPGVIGRKFGETWLLYPGGKLQ